MKICAVVISTEAAAPIFDFCMVKCGTRPKSLFLYVIVW